MAILSVSVVSADQEVWTGEAKQLITRTVEGEIGILPGHEPIMAILGAGEVRITLADGSVVKAMAEDGFLSVAHDVVTVVARTASLTAAIADSH
ncbi:MAG: F0F1 ATP synthase subunit epsilon [Terrimesophilobacter sp.]